MHFIYNFVWAAAVDYRCRGSWQSFINFYGVFYELTIITAFNFWFVLQHSVSKISKVVGTCWQIVLRKYIFSFIKTEPLIKSDRVMQMSKHQLNLELTPLPQILLNSFSESSQQLHQYLVDPERVKKLTKFQIKHRWPSKMSIAQIFTRMNCTRKTSNHKTWNTKCFFSAEQATSTLAGLVMNPRLRCVNHDAEYLKTFLSSSPILSGWCCCFVSSSYARQKSGESLVARDFNAPYPTDHFLHHARNKRENIVSLKTAKISASSRQSGAIKIQNHLLLSRMMNIYKSSYWFEIKTWNIWKSCEW